MKDFITPPNHINFLAKRLFSDCGEIIDGSIAYLAPKGGGPIETHIHDHNHLFIVISGRAKIIMKDKEIVVDKDESYLVDGSVPHSVWNDTDTTTVMIGISVKKR
ncbi:MAG: cupin domain-containing protein [Bacteroidales bacterium]